MSFEDQHIPFEEQPWRFEDLPKCDLIIDLWGISNGPKAGILFSVEPATFPLVIGTRVVESGPYSLATNENGVVTFSLPKGGKFYLTSSALKGQKIPVDTTDKSMIRLSELLATL